MHKIEVLTQVRSSGLIPMLRVRSANEAVRAAEALHEAGINVIEIPLNVPEALMAISEIIRRFDEGIVVGAGTVLDVESASTVIAAGASFIVSPSLERAVVEFCNAADAPVFAGALTPTEIVNAWKAGADMVKVFPCAAMGGPDYIRAVKRPLPHIELCPTGGVSLQNAAAYIDAGAAVLGVGSDLLDAKALRERRFELITERARLFIEIIRDAREGGIKTPMPLAETTRLPIPAGLLDQQ